VLLAFEGKEYELAAGETVLECLERNGARVASLCRNGACQTCLMRAEDGTVPAAAQQGLKQTWRAQGWFLPCVCRPTTDLKLTRCDGAREYGARVTAVEQLAPRVLRVLLTRPPDLAYEAGQFIQLSRPADGLMRPYSLASTPDEEHLELHVALLADGRMSGWLANAVDEQVTLRGPYGECFYVREEASRPLLLAGTGTGLAPLYGVLRAALAAGHQAAVRLLHGASDRHGLYLWEPLRQLAERHPQLALAASVRDGADHAGISNRPLQELVADSGVPLADARIYLCGNPDFVRGMRKQLYLAGASLARIHADAFLPPADRPHS
jgi:CDP-4-dehydro-6-deoxyglucose reductase, E3